MLSSKGCGSLMKPKIRQPTYKPESWKPKPHSIFVFALIILLISLGNALLNNPNFILGHWTTIIWVRKIAPVVAFLFIAVSIIVWVIWIIRSVEIRKESWVARISPLSMGLLVVGAVFITFGAAILLFAQGTWISITNSLCTIAGLALTFLSSLPIFAPVPPSNQINSSIVPESSMPQHPSETSVLSDSLAHRSFSQGSQADKMYSIQGDPPPSSPLYIQK